MTLDGQVNQMEIPTIPREAEVLIVCGWGRFRSSHLEKILISHGYRKVDHAGVESDQWGRMVTPEMLETAKYLIAVDPYVATQLLWQYTPREDQTLILLQVPVYDHITHRNFDEEQIKERLAMQIAPYLA